MNYYRRYVGDYLRDTSELSLAEHGAYCLLLDYYYAEEKPLPADQRTLYRKLRALDAAEQRAVDSVIRQFFEMHADGYHQKRADREIRVSKSARTNGRLGGRPTHHQETDEETGDETGLLTGIVTEHETEAITGSGHPPTTNHQPPAANHQPPSEKVKTVSPEPSEKPARSRPAPRWNGAMVAMLPVVGGSAGEIAITQEFVDEMQAAYPAIDVAATLPEIRAWCVANPSKRKTPGGIHRFVQSWLSREQNRG